MKLELIPPLENNNDDDELDQEIKKLATLISQDSDDPRIIVRDIMRAYLDRSHQLPDWWVWSRFHAVFGACRNARAASESLNRLLRCSAAIIYYEGTPTADFRLPWYKRIWHWRTHRRARKELLAMLDALIIAEHSWADRSDFHRYMSGRTPRNLP